MEANLRLFDLETLESFRKARKNVCGGKEGSNKAFFDELEYILKNGRDCQYPKWVKLGKDGIVIAKDFHQPEWVKLEKDAVVLGDVWQQEIGDVWHAKTRHHFSYLFIKSCYKAIDLHGPHEEKALGYHTPRNISEWYIFDDGTMEQCKKGDKHKLENRYDHPIFVLSVKISNNSHSPCE